jgi:adenylylsulfate kinase
MSEASAENIVWHHGHISRDDRRSLLGQTGCTVWFTGLPSSGKSTIAFEVERRLVARGHAAYVLDGDNVRHGLCSNLGFSKDDRVENIRRIGEVARLFADSGLIALASFVSPYREDRRRVRHLHETVGLPFLEVFIDTPVDACESRDPKGLYKKARAGEIGNFTGVNDPYEPPERAELTVKTTEDTVEAGARAVIENLQQRGLIDAS